MEELGTQSTEKSVVMMSRNLPNRDLEGKNLNPPKRTTEVVVESTLEMEIGQSLVTLASKYVMIYLRESKYWINSRCLISNR